MKITDNAGDRNLRVIAILLCRRPWLGILGKSESGYEIKVSSAVCNATVYLEREKVFMWRPKLSKKRDSITFDY